MESLVQHVLLNRCRRIGVVCHTVLKCSAPWADLSWEFPGVVDAKCFSVVRQCGVQLSVCVCLCLYVALMFHRELALASAWGDVQSFSTGDSTAFSILVCTTQKDSNKTNLSAIGLTRSATRLKCQWHSKLAHVCVMIPFGVVGLFTFVIALVLSPAGALLKLTEMVISKKINGVFVVSYALRLPLAAW